MLTIKVLGSGCPNCRKVEAVARQAIARLAIEAQVVKVTDYAEIMRYGVLATPGLVIEDKVVCAGRIPGEAEVSQWLGSARAAAQHA
jgi:small redox-active disulfide protein 2